MQNGVDNKKEEETVSDLKKKFFEKMFFRIQEKWRDKWQWLILIAIHHYTTLCVKLNLQCAQHKIKMCTCVFVFLQ